MAATTRDHYTVPMQHVVIDEMQIAIERDREMESLRGRLGRVAKLLEEIACVNGVDAGVVLCDHESTTHTEMIDGRSMVVYDHEHFSELGDSLIKIYRIATGKDAG